MPRIFCNSSLVVQDRYELPQEAARHVQVLRLQPGSKITLFNGEGGEFEAIVVEMTRKDVFAQIIKFLPIERESRLSVHLAIGMPANERMEWLIEKATELGLSKLTPLMTQHNVVRLNPERGDKKLLHWNAIAHAACSQCGRNRAPVIESPITFMQWLKTLSDRENIIRWYFTLSTGSEPLLKELERIKSLPNKFEGSFLITVGPEGGWSSLEEEALKTHHFLPVSLGDRTLRTETAAIATVATLNIL